MNRQSDAAPGEARLESAVVASIPLGVYVLDRDWRFLYLNGAAERFFGPLCGRSREQLLGNSIWELCPEVADSTFSKEYHQAVAEQRTFELETYYPQLNRWFQVLAPITEDLRCIYFQDVTERTRLERELHLRLDQLAETDRGKDQFLLHLAHEVRNALAPVRNALHLLKTRGDDGGADTEAEALAEREIQYLTHLMDDLLRVVHLEHEARTPICERFDLAQVIARAIQDALVSPQGRGRHFDVKLPAEPLWLEGDPRDWAEVLMQVLSNANRFTTPGGSIWVSAAAEGDMAVVRVRDNGVGMAASVLPKVFNLFMRGEQALDRTHCGMGIGLTLVRKFVERQGGSVEAKSEGPGLGSEFIVRLPLAAMREEESTAPSDGAGSPLRVLLVDNSIDAVQSFALLLRQWGYQAREAYDGPTGLQEADAWLPNVVVLDIGMPGMDGYEVARQLRRNHKDGMVLVALTGYGEDEDRQRARQAGFDFHLVKPISPDELKELLAGVEAYVRPPVAAV